MVASVVLAVPLGVAAALKRNSWLDYGIRIFAVLGQAASLTDAAAVALIDQAAARSAADALSADGVLRRGMPMSPDQCIGMNVRFIPMNASQKCHEPSASLNNRPVSFGK